jgi:hypothetical protein
MAKKNFWKVTLRPNLLTKNVDNDNIAEVSTAGNTLRNEDIARQIVEGRSEVRYETILSILGERDAVVRNAVLGGSSVQDGNVHLAPRVTGSWIGPAPTFNPAVHKITFDATPAAEFRKALDEEVGVEVVGRQTGGGSVIGLVTDVFTGKTDGTITPGGDIIITGEKIKIAPDKEDGLGVFFVSAGGGEIPLEYPIAENNPRKILCRLPGQIYSGGVYTLKIVTRYTSGSIMLKQPRTILYELPLTALTPQPNVM